ncbi:MAG: SemiSWEET transporter [Cyanobacteria bacterium P01_C01_bin.120]|mgnify:CR=1 FL=1
MDLTTTLGIVAGTLTTFAYFPQVLKTWRSRSADGMSWSMLIILCIGIALWLVYGVYAHDMPLIMANLLTLVFSSAILAVKIRYEAVPKLRAQRQLITPSAATLQPSLVQKWQLETEVTFTQPEPDSSSPVA